MANVKPYLLCFLSSLISLLLLIRSVSCKEEEVRVGVILDKVSNVGRIAEKYMLMAKTDFYVLNPHFRTRVSLVVRDSYNDDVSAAAAAIDLMKKEEVHAIIGPETTSEAKFVISLGEKARVPIISFSATSPTLSSSMSNYFIRTAQNDAFQVETLAEIIQYYRWKEVIFVREDTDYGNGLLVDLDHALHKVNCKILDTSIISLNANDTDIAQELGRLKGQRSKIFVVHMTASLGSMLFVQAHKLGMMEKGFAWIVTQGLSTLLDPVDSKGLHAMEYVLGVRPYIPKSKKLASFKSRLNDLNKPNGSMERLNLFGLWAYDTVWAIAMAVERADRGNLVFRRQNASQILTDIAGLGMSEMGPKILKELVNTKFIGLSGQFQLENGESKRLGFEIFNVIDKNEIVIGCWTQNRGLSLDMNDHNSTNSKHPRWPGNTAAQPQKKLRIGVPVRNVFTEFVKYEGSFPGFKCEGNFSGFSIEVFCAVYKLLEDPFLFEFIPYNKTETTDASYDELLYEIKNGNFDAVVGDTTIVANRSTYVDFTLPYSESGVSMVVLVKDDDRKNLWIFLKPLKWDLWLTSGVAFFFTGLVVWTLEHRINTEFRGPLEYQVGTILWFAFSTIVFAHREKVLNNLSRFVLIIWIFVALILTQSYTASLTSMLTVQRMQPAYADVKEIQSSGLKVGYQRISFVKHLLTKQLKFDESKVKGYDTPEAYHEALSTGEVAAILDETPYLRSFISKHCKKYMMIGLTYRTDGFGFAFPQGSPLVSNFSRAILNVTEDNDKMRKIEKNTMYKNKPATCEDQAAKPSSDYSLSVYSFGGLFIITGVTSISALFIYIFMFVHSHWPAVDDPATSGRSFWSRVVELAKQFDKKDLSSHVLKRCTSTVLPDVQIDDHESKNVENHPGGTSEATKEDDVAGDGNNEVDRPVQVNGDEATV